MGKYRKKTPSLPIEDTGSYHGFPEVAARNAAGQEGRVQLHDQPETCPG